MRRLGQIADKSVDTDVALFRSYCFDCSTCLCPYPIPRSCNRCTLYLHRWIPESPLHLQSLRPEATSRHPATGRRGHLERREHLLGVLSGVRRALVPRALFRAEVGEIEEASMLPIPMCSTRTSPAFDRDRPAPGEHLPRSIRHRHLVEALETDLTRPC